MNYLRTAILLAGLTALFMGIGFLIGGQSGAMIALIVAAGMNFFAYWNADRLVLSMHAMRGVRPISIGSLVTSLRARACRCRASFSWTTRSRTRSPQGAIRSTPQWR